MNRRTFVKTASAFAAGLAVGDNIAPAQATPHPALVEKWRGVNLGGWLVLEKWMTPSLFAGTKAEDEYTLSETLGPKAAADRLKQHREHWITERDFRWIAEHGLNAVRLPVGYWIAEENPPFVTGLETLNRAFEMAKRHGLGVLLDLHGAPGSQNGMDHSGRQGTLGWHTNPENIAHTLRVLENLAAHCKAFDNLIGIELLNEPRWDVPLDILQAFYRDAYPRIRKHIRPEQAAMVFHDGFRPFDWADFMTGPDYANVILDTHLYQIYTDADRKRDIHAQVDLAVLQRKRELDTMQKTHPCIVGEWSCGLPGESVPGLSGFRLDAALRAYAAAQLVSYETTRGWFFWNYKLDSDGGWNFRDCVKRGWLPDNYR